MRFLLLFVAFALAAPAELGLPLGRSLRVSVGDDHVFVQLRSVVEPKDLDRGDWSDFDRDRDGVLSAGESAPLLEAIRRDETRFTALSVGEVPLPLASLPITAELDEGPWTLDTPVVFRIQGRVELEHRASGTPFVLYDRPRAWQGSVPVRLSVAKGLAIEGVVGGHAELRSPTRLDAVLTNPRPAAWGTINRRP